MTSKKKKIRISSSRGVKASLVVDIIILAIALVLGSLANFVYKDDTANFYLLSIIATSLTALSVVGMIFIFVAYQKIKKETGSITKDIVNQLDNLDSGKVKLLGKEYENEALSELQNRINNLVLKRKENGYKEGESYSISGKTDLLLDEYDFLHSAKEATKEAQSYRSAMVSVKILGSSKVPEGASKAVFEEILKRFPHSYIYRAESDLYFFYIPAIGSMYGLNKALELFVSKFAYMEVDKESDISNVFYLKIGASIYPYVEAERLMGSAMRALDNEGAVTINAGNGQIYLPSAIHDTDQKRVVLLSANQMYRNRFYKCKNAVETRIVLEEVIDYYSKILSFDLGGILAYDSTAEKYRVMVEKSVVSEGLGLRDVSKDGIIEKETIEPLFSFLANEGLSFVYNSHLLPKEAAQMCQSIGASSMLLIPIEYQDKRYGLAYFASSKNVSVNLFAREKADSFAALISPVVIELIESHSAESFRHILGSILKKSGKYIYTIDSDYKIVRYDPSLERKLENISKGQYCYKAIMGNDEPCKDCPLRGGTIKALIPALNATEMSLSLLPSPRGGSPYSTILIEKEGILGSAGGFHHDKNLFIHNAKAFNQDVSREIRSRGTGFVLSVRVENAKQISPDNIDSLMRSIVGRIEDLGYTDFCYRHDKTTLSFLLKGNTRPLSVLFAEEIANSLETEIPLDQGMVTPEASYSLIAYPSEASTEFELDSLINTELERSLEFGKGFLTEIGKTSARKAKRSSYIQQVIQESLKRDQVKITVLPVVRTATDKVEAAYCSLTLQGYAKEKISKKEFLPVASEKNLVTELEFAGLSKVKAFYKTYSENALRLAECQRLIWQASYRTVSQDKTIDVIDAFVKETRIRPENFILATNAREIHGHEIEAKGHLDKLKALGIKLMVTSYDANIDKTETLAELGFSYIRTTSTLIEDAMASESGNNLFIRSVGAFPNHGVSAVVNGVVNEDQIQFCRDLSLPFYVDMTEGDDLTEQAFVSYLNYR
ncbi:MAG: EAL domain-containing protein [Bacilli bacterium]|nr:EAL domain-containing protein [Bacilli bacterium]